MTATDTAPASRCPDHPTYRAGCRHCQTVAAARSRARTRAKAYGHWQPANVPAAAARQHINHLRSHRMTLRQISEAAGVAHTSVDNIAASRVAEIRRRTAQAILAVQPAPPKDGHLVDGTGTARRLQALAAIGYSADDLAPLLGEAPVEVRRLRRRYRPGVHARRHAKVAAVYARLEGTPGPSGKARAEARARNWAPPLVWEDDTQIDDPAAAVRYSAAALSARIVRKAVAGEVSAADLNEAERRQVVGRLVAEGLTARQIGDRLAWSGGGRPGRVAVTEYLRRHGLAPVVTPAPQRWRAA